MKLLFFDLETTGVDSKNCAIIQLAGIMVEIDPENNLKPVDAINLKMKPRKGKTVEQEALAINNYSLNDIMEWENDAVAFKKFMTFIEKHVVRFNSIDKIKLCGYNNSRFDTDFLRQWFKENDNLYFGSYFWVDQIDVMCEASRYLIHYRPALNNFKLGNIANVLGVPLDENSLHDGFYDIKITYKIFKKILESGNLIMPYDENIAKEIFIQQQNLKNNK